MQYITNKKVFLDKDELIPIYAVANDNKRCVNYMFFNGNSCLDLTGATLVSIYAMNSQYEEINKNLTVLGNKAQLELSSDLLKRGITQYQLKIQYQDGTVLKTKKMQIVVSEDMEERS